MLARTRKIFVNARMFGFLSMAKLGNVGETCTRYDCFWKHTSSERHEKMMNIIIIIIIIIIINIVLRPFQLKKE